MESETPDDVKDLFARAMIGLDDEDGDDGPADPPTGREAISRLHQIATRDVLDEALAACADADPMRREVGAAVLGQLGHTHVGFEPVFTEERYQGLSCLVATERAGDSDAAVLDEACVALGHLGDSRAIPTLLDLIDHEHSSVRFGVAIALGGFKTPEAVARLIALSSDVDDGVRDWATLGFAQHTDLDAPEIRAALHARLDDDCFDVRAEAMEGLAKRGDRSVLPALDRELRDGAAQPLLDAAIALADPQLCEALREAAKDGLAIQTEDGPYDLTPVWEEAMRACGCAKR